MEISFRKHFLYSFLSQIRVDFSDLSLHANFTVYGSKGELVQFWKGRVRVTLSVLVGRH